MSTKKRAREKERDREKGEREREREVDGRYIVVVHDPWLRKHHVP